MAREPFDPNNDEQVPHYFDAVDAVDLSAVPPRYLSFLTDEERRVVVAKFWDKTTLVDQAAGNPVALLRIQAAYRSALSKLRELLE